MRISRRVLFVLLVAVFLAAFVFLSDSLTRKADAASLSGAKVTLANSRLSYKAGVATGSSGSSVVTIDNSSQPDINTGHLFPGDVLCFTDAGQNGCIGSKSYTVASVIDGTTFNLTSTLTNNLDTSGYAVATQSGQWTVSFTTVAAVPVGGSILITIPEADGVSAVQSNNGIPDSGSSVALSGFDLNSLAAGGISITGCTPANWSTPVVTVGDGTTNHTISIPRVTADCTGGTAIVVTLGTGTPYIVNPAPYIGHTQGISDVYGVTVQTKDAGDNVVDSAIPRAAAVEAVLISASVDESLSLTVDFVTAATLYNGGVEGVCGTVPALSDARTTTVTSVPWGTITQPNHFLYAAQKLTVSTNAATGYVVTFEENDQMGRNGNTCTGTSPSAGDYTFGAGTCIRDTTCNGSCSESVMGDWQNATSYPGLGYSLASASGTDAPFFYNQGGGSTWYAKQLADKTQGGETAQTIMSNGAPVSGSAVYVCYKFTIPGTQPAGYYYNIGKYTTTSTF
ncbi:MAG: hypothetical protein UW20_C0004G0008 [Candidatus Woesebacteria bacterium GW2011_GWB1_44_11]|uniref:Uncharacterized protein n=1 Tax=Candidatus Woesebacteria bacterium GW2011_GWB1_44_11 TaxID=1618579 RepID=A0A837I5R1_9BACT|nr:MAG: hypothetical protein UW20_C0004G0008 [Candidatus Woesebacteria bacterium GW2011_GWB1_44_11]